MWRKFLQTLKLIGKIWKIGRRDCGGWTPSYKGKARWTSVWKDTGMGVLKETLHGKPSTTMCYGECAFAYWHLAWVMQSPGSSVDIICGNIDRACIYVLYSIGTPGRG